MVRGSNLGETKLNFIYAKMCMYDSSLIALKFGFLEIFQKLPDGLFIAARRLMLILVFSGVLKRNHLTVHPWQSFP